MSGSTGFYVPVYLFSYSLYRTRRGPADLFKAFALHENNHLVVIADRLLGLDRLITGGDRSVEQMLHRARREAELVFGQFEHVARVFRAQDKGMIAYWDDIADRPDYIAFARNMRALAMGNGDVWAALQRFAQQRVAAHGAGVHPDRELTLEMDYLLSEICMSVFCTELLGYRCEVRERPLQPGIPDPVHLLYTHHRPLIAQATGRFPMRRMLHLYAERPAELIPHAGTLHEPLPGGRQDPCRRGSVCAEPDAHTRVAGGE
jgi:hypothetical protein